MKNLLLLRRLTGRAYLVQFDTAYLVMFKLDRSDIEALRSIDNARNDNQPGAAPPGHFDRLVKSMDALNSCGTDCTDGARLRTDS
jgi:hypothetical protein